VAALLSPSFNGTPEILVHDAELRGLDPKPFVLGALPLVLGAAADGLLTAVPGDDASVQLAPQDFENSSRCPAQAVATRRRDPVPVKVLAIFTRPRPSA
jgi:hypothetical protein